MDWVSHVVQAHVVCVEALDAKRELAGLLLAVPMHFHPQTRPAGTLRAKCRSIRQLQVHA